MPPPDPLYLATATEIVLKAGAIQMARRGTGFRVDKKSTIDLVTEVDLECERMCRALVAERFPEHEVLGEELSPDLDAPPSSRFRWVFDPLDGTTNYAHGLPIFCSSLALEIDGRGEAAAIFDPSRGELFTAERGVGAFLNGERLTTSTTAGLIDALLVTGFPYDVHKQSADLVQLFGAFLSKARAVRRLGSAALGPVLRRRGPVRRLLGTASQAVGRGRRRADRDRGRRRDYGNGRQPVRCARRAPGGLERTPPRPAAGRHPRVPRRPFVKEDRPAGRTAFPR